MPEQDTDLTADDAADSTACSTIDRATDRATAKSLAKARARAAYHAARDARLAAPAGSWRGWFDGSATPNPGVIGIGALLCGPGGERVEISRRAGDGSSSEAEYLALIALLEAAQAAGAAPLTVYGDSQVVIADAAGNAKPAAGLEEYRSRAQDLLAQLKASEATGAAVTLRWIPRHRNGDADRLSQQAVAGGPPLAALS